MIFEKQIIDDMFKCYSVNNLTIDGEPYLIYAGEGPGECKLYSGDDFKETRTLWEGGGGTMTLVTVPDHEGYFFASKGFYSMVESETSAVYLIRYRDGIFTEEKVVDIPYLHRFDVMIADGHRYLIGAALHDGKVDKEDWSKPGKLFVAELPMDLDQTMAVELQLLKEGLTKNHGFNRGPWKGNDAAFIATEEGVFAVIPPRNEDDWRIDHVFPQPVSDVAVMDMDGDGEVEFALLSPFHGDGFDIYKKVDGDYVSVFSYHKPLDFYHAVYADYFNGKPTYVIGARKESMDLFIVQYDQASGSYKSYVLETMAGASNARIIRTKDGDRIMAANRQINQASLYALKD